MNTKTPGINGLKIDEPLLWERGRKGKIGFSLPRQEVPHSEAAKKLTGPVPDLPGLSEPEVVRHYTRLSQWNYGLDTGLYPLGSCTMKYNPKTHEVQAQRPGFVRSHPLLDPALAQGPLQLMYELERLLGEITGMDAATLQPAAGAHGEYTGLHMMYAFYQEKGQDRRKIIIPDTAHGTNPATATMCGFKTVPIPSNDRGILSPETVEAAMDDEVAGIMVTNPNTLGLFESNIQKIAAIVHRKGGLVYCDGANFNALMGIADMARSGIDLLHLNLHKTFSAPHGGGGPGSGPVCVRQLLEPFLPRPRIVKNGDRFTLCEDLPLSIGRVHSFFGNFSVMVKAYCYILSMGRNLERASEMAVLNANYLRCRLEPSLHLPFQGPCMHECVFSDAKQRDQGVSTLDMAKALIDEGFHPPTIYFPLVVEGAMMVEPTETECKEELDQFVEAVQRIAEMAQTAPDKLHSAPQRTKVTRLDEIGAARKPHLTG